MNNLFSNNYKQFLIKVNMCLCMRQLFQKIKY